jgi:hypothetical protein
MKQCVEKYIRVNKGSERILVSLDAYLESEIRWGKPFLWVCGVITFISIASMVWKHI